MTTHIQRILQKSIQGQPAIKSDNWIKAMCTPPGFLVTERISNVTDGKISFENVEYLTQASQAMIESQILRKLFNDDPGNVSGIVSYRPTTPEDYQGFVPMIDPFIPHQVKQDEAGRRILSKGLSSMGYDVTLDRKFKIFTNVNSAIIDPLNMTDDCYVDFEGDEVIIPPNSYILGVTNEYFCIPRDIMVICVGKSTLARAGAIVNVTPIESGWRGKIVIEISNATPLPMKIHANMGCAQFMFFQSDRDCDISYGDRNGKYQGQTSLVTARV